MIGQLHGKLMASEPTRKGGSHKSIFLEAGTKQLVVVYAVAQLNHGDPVLEDRTYQLTNVRGFAGGLGADEITVLPETGATKAKA